MIATIAQRVEHDTAVDDLLDTGIASRDTCSTTGMTCEWSYSTVMIQPANIDSRRMTLPHPPELLKEGHGSQHHSETPTTFPTRPM
ncbi:hypothetical protein BST61_g6904 [Cercospora zeina]